MMKNILEELYFGNISPNDKLFIRGSNYDKAMQTLTTNEDRLTERLTGLEQSLFLDFVNAECEINSITAIEYFAEGFRLGAKIMLEVMQGQGGSLKDVI